MQIIRTVEAMRAEAQQRRREGRRLALVPTMGALHRGHLALVEEAKRQADHVTVSIFVNPTQFGPGEDFEDYPRQREDDRQTLAEGGGVDVIFAPTKAALYPDGQEQQRIWVEVETLDEHLCGRYRPGHFRGVVTVVAKLFNICLPDVAVFGRKDAQQFLILRRMVRDLNIGTDIVGVPTVREDDGLALSSRNAYLSADERRQARVLSQAVRRAQQLVEGGEQRASAIVESMRKIMAQAPDANVQYADVVDVDTLQPIEHIQPGQDVLAAVAVFFGDTRLIDNAFAQAPDS